MPPRQFQCALAFARLAGLPLRRTPAALWLALLLPAACAHQPLDYIPGTDRAMLQAQARLGADPAQTASGGSGGAIGVDALLAQAREKAANDKANSGISADAQRLTLHFAPGQSRPDDAAQRSLADFASSHPGASLRVITRKSPPAEDASLLAMRRAVAVAQILQSFTQNVVIALSVTTDADTIIVTSETLASETSSGTAP